MSEELKYNEFFQNKLGQYESSVSEDIFARIMQKRENHADSAADLSLRERLQTLTSPVSDGLFERIMHEREQPKGAPLDTAFRERLQEHASPVSDGLFERIMREREQPNEAPLDMLFRERLQEHVSPISDAMFERLMGERQVKAEPFGDSALREKLLEYPSYISPSTFDNIIKERKRRRRAFFWRSLAVALLFLLSYFLWHVNRNPSNTEGVKSAKPIVVEHKTEQAAHEIIKNKSAFVDTKHNGLTKDYTNKQITQNNNNNIVKSGLFVDKNGSDKSPISTNNLRLGQSPVSAGGALLSARVASAVLPSTVNVLNTGSKPTGFFTETASTQKTANLPSVTTTGDKTSAIGAIELTTLTDGDRVVGKNDLKMDNSIHFDSLTTTQSLFSTLDVLNLLKLKGLPVPLPAKVNPLPPGYGCPTFGKNKPFAGDHATYIDVYAAPEYAFRHLTENLPVSANYAKARDSVEKSLFAFSSGARASLVLENGLMLRTGLIYAQTIEKATFDTLGIGQKITIQTFIPKKGGGQDTIWETRTTQGILRTKLYNRYHSVDIPLHIGYEFQLNDYWNLNLNGGLNINISAWRKANILGEDLKRLDVSSGIGVSNPVFRTSLGMSLVANVGLYREISENLQLMVEPSIRLYMKPITNSAYPLAQSYVNGGLNIGLRYRLGY